jgi:hypothetical protein
MEISYGRDGSQRVSRIEQAVQRIEGWNEKEKAAVCPRRRFQSGLLLPFARRGRQKRIG